MHVQGESKLSIQIVRAVTNFFFILRKVNQLKRDATYVEVQINIILLARNGTIRHVARTESKQPRHRGKTHHEIQKDSVTPQELKDQALLTVNNERSMEINNKVLEFMPGNETVYKAVDMIMSEDPPDQLTFPEEFLNSLTPTGLPPY
ncbi:hypothetical protein AVEN_218100-1 [Araneus ventricosus]|uniref:Uncharacterized protein n=1 Tax=Araneus ventricosus TaxID=182803 RepID=A0A4Y2PKV5_ARAVE|nr:hypothetical protein AVEN_218100-1 [Araneus ventricosus]